PTCPASVVSFTISLLTRLIVDVDVRTGAGNGADRKYVSSAVIFIVPSPIRRSRADHDPLVKAAQHLIDRGRGPEVEERRCLKRGDRGRVALRCLLFGLAGACGVLVVADLILVVEVGILEVAEEFLEAARVKPGARQRRPPPAVLLVHELDHEVV